MAMSLTYINEFCPGTVIGAQVGGSIVLMNSGVATSNPNYGSVAIYDNGTNTAR